VWSVGRSVKLACLPTGQSIVMGGPRRQRASKCGPLATLFEGVPTSRTKHGAALLSGRKCTLCAQACTVHIAQCGLARDEQRRPARDPSQCEAAACARAASELLGEWAGRRAGGGDILPSASRPFFLLARATPPWRV